jgi:hypothetical protein
MEVHVVDHPLAASTVSDSMREKNGGAVIAARPNAEGLIVNEVTGEAFTSEGVAKWKCQLTKKIEFVTKLIEKERTKAGQLYKWRNRLLLTGFCDLVLAKILAPYLQAHQTPIRLRQTQSTFHPRAQRNAFHCRDVRLQSRLFVRENLGLMTSNFLQSSSHSVSKRNLRFARLMVCFLAMCSRQQTIERG